MALRFFFRRGLSAAICYGHRLSPTSSNATNNFHLFEFSYLYRESALVPPFFRPLSTTSIRAEAAGSKKGGSAEKRARQAEKRRIRNKSRKTLIKTRMKKVFKSIDEVKVSSSPSMEDFKAINKLISEAQSAIDKAVKGGTLHKNTAARRKSRLFRRKKAVQIQLGMKKPATDKKQV
ncbi:hypothetical protein SUGI_1150540 [Cryptomeria japonica]|uniref:small ribosomal subunit protein bS20c n=1 Tax=Cryptomeria japonica TaxID=3369 RepID=UPI0024147730|nr:small ribosomal subunit protein bS20c [Cryptomeria japonica]GLJ53872.1 hypothetical protein SUGI_1150540 [Cryptomeria japonica]